MHFLSPSLREKKEPSAKWPIAVDPKLIFNLVDRYPWILCISIPNQFQKGLGDTVVKLGSNGDRNSGSLMGLHQGGAQGVQSTMGQTGRAQGVHGERTVHVCPNFFAFQARAMKFGEQN